MDFPKSSSKVVYAPQIPNAFYFMAKTSGLTNVESTACLLHTTEDLSEKTGT